LPVYPPGQAQSAHGCLGPGADHAHHVDAGNRVYHGLGQLDLKPAGRAEARALGRCVGDGRRHLRVVVAEKHGPPGHDVVDEFGPILGGELAAARRGDEKRIAVHALAGPHGAVDAARDEGSGLLEKFL